MSKKEIMLGEKRFDDRSKKKKKLKKKTLTKLSEKQKEEKENDPTTDFRKEIKDRDKSIKKMTATIEELETSIEKLQSEVVKTVAEKKSLENELKECDELNDDLRSQLKESEKLNEDLISKNKELEDEIDSLQERLKNTDEKTITKSTLDEGRVCELITHLHTLSSLMDEFSSEDALEKMLEIYENNRFVQRYHRSLSNHNEHYRELVSNHVFIQKFLRKIVCDFVECVGDIGPCDEYAVKDLYTVFSDEE